MSSSASCCPTGCTPRPWWSGRTSGSATGPRATCRCWPAGREVRLHRRGRAAARGRRRDDLLVLHQGAAGRRGRGRGRGGAGPPAPGGGRRRPRSHARPGAGFPDRQPGDPAAHRDPRRRRLRRLADQPGPRRNRGQPLARRDLGRHQPDLRHGDRTVEAYALDRDDLDLYGAHAAIDFAARLRGTERFDSVEALVTQMREDVIQARALTVG